MTLETRQLTCSLIDADGVERSLFSDLNLRFREGCFTALIGPNGCGKTTLLRHLVGVRQAHKGELWLDNKPIKSIALKLFARKVAYLPQATPLYTDLKVKEVVMLGRTPYMYRFLPASQKDHQSVEDALGHVGLASFAHHLVSRLSGGERQRVMLARLLVSQATTLVLDEPTTGLDINHTLSFLELCRDLCDKNVTLIVAMHELDLARRYADHIVCLPGNGEKPLVGSVDKVMTQENLAKVFQVQATQVGEHLHFSPPA